MKLNGWPECPGLSLLSPDNCWFVGSDCVGKLAAFLELNQMEVPLEVASQRLLKQRLTRGGVELSNFTMPFLKGRLL